SSTASAVTALAAPSGLSATTASTSQINLAWSDNSASEVGYRVERSPDGSTNWAQVGSDLAANTTSYNNTGLSDGTIYYYRVRAFNTAAGNSANSSTANAVTTLAAP